MVMKNIYKDAEHPFAKYVRNHLIDHDGLWYDTISEFWADDIEQAANLMNGPVGEILREDVLGNLGLSVGEAASRLGISRVTLSRVLHGHARVSPNLAVRLEGAGVGTARAWLALQSAHDLAAERAAGLPSVRKLDPVA